MIDQGVVFFGGYALSMYAKHMPSHLQRKLEKIPDFDVLSEDPQFTAEIVRERLMDVGVKNVKILKRPGVGEVIAPHFELKVGTDTVAFMYKPLACHSYNVVRDHHNKVKIATLDTMLSFWLAFLYANRPYYDKDRILCMATYLFDVQEKNRLSQKGLLRRFSIDCMGHQETVEEMRAEKAEKFNELKDHKNSPEFEEWFLRYRPADNATNNKPSTQNIKTKNKKTTNKTNTSKKHKKTNKKKTRKRTFFFG